MTTLRDGLCQHSCAGKDQAAYRIAMRQTVIVLCADHRAWAEGQGLTLIPVERRTQAVPVSVNRRRVAWLRGGRLARVFGEVAA